MSRDGGGVILRDYAKLMSIIEQIHATDFDAKAAANVERNAEARRAWADGRRLVVGGYYKHRKAGFVRRVLELQDNGDVMWIDDYGSRWPCKRSTFLQKVSGPI